MKSLFSFDGRILRSRFWQLTVIGFLCPSVITFVMVLIFGLAVTAVFPDASSSGAGASLFIMAIVLGSVIASFVIFFSSAVRRFHDRGKSGWWSLIGLVPFIGGIWILVECGCLKGTDGPNQYGDDPFTQQNNVSPVVVQVQPVS